MLTTNNVVIINPIIPASKAVILPNCVFGYKSPKPTKNIFYKPVDIEIIIHQKQFEKLENY